MSKGNGFWTSRSAYSSQYLHWDIHKNSYICRTYGSIGIHEGTIVPSFITDFLKVRQMEGNRLQQRVTALLDEALAGRPDLFLLDLKVGLDQSIHVTLDGDQGISLKDCMAISRAIEHELDREEFDFSLEVGSAGATAPLILPRQYAKHLGRKLKVTREGSDIEGTLTAADSEGITLNWKVREPKPIGKGKHTVKKEAVVPYSEIREAKVVLTF